MDVQNIVGAYEAKTHLAEILDKVQAGAEFTITRHGAPIAKLTAIRRGATVVERRAAIARIRKLASGMSLRGLKIKDLIAEGRR